MEEQDYKKENRRLLLVNAGLLDELAQQGKDLEDRDNIIKERNFWYGVVSELWERAQRAIVRRE